MAGCSFTIPSSNYQYSKCSGAYRKWKAIQKILDTFLKLLIFKSNKPLAHLANGIEMTKNRTKITAEPGKQEVVITREFNASCELVFKAFIDPMLYSQW